MRAFLKVFGTVARLTRFADTDDQVEACRRVFKSDTRWTVNTRWTVVRRSDFEEGGSEDTFRSGTRAARVASILVRLSVQVPILHMKLDVP